MKNSWIVWLIIVGVVVAIFISFNQNQKKESVPLSEIFPEEQAPVDIEYEFVDGKPVANIIEKQVADVTVPQKASVAPEAPSTPEKKVSAPKVEAPTAPAAAVDRPVSSSYTIQVGSFKDKPKAEKQVKELTEKGYDAYVGQRNLGEKGIWYRSYVGHFATKLEAESTLNKIQPDYAGSFIIAPSSK